MSEKMHVDNLGLAETGNGPLKLFEPPRTVESLLDLKDRGSNRSPDTRPQSEAATRMLSKEMRRSANRKVAPDLRSNCPVCGNPYQPGEEVLALACLSFATSAVPSSPAAAGCDPSTKITLGHYGCVLPRLLTLIAGFQPEGRFVLASRDFTAAETVFPERYHDQP